MPAPIRVSEEEKLFLMGVFPKGMAFVIIHKNLNTFLARACNTCGLFASSSFFAVVLQ